MTYVVIYSPVVRVAIARQIDHLKTEAVSKATRQRWLMGLHEKIEGLHDWPLRFPVDHEMTRRVQVEVRRMIYGHYVIHYRVDQQPAKQVILLSFQRAAQDRRRR